MGLCWFTGDDVPCREYAKEVVAQFSSAEELAASAQRSARFVKHEVIGAAKLAPETAKAVSTAVRHPIKTGKAVAESAVGAVEAGVRFVELAVEDPDEAVALAKSTLDQKLLAMSSADPDEAAEATGKLLAGIAAGGVAAKAVSKAGSAIRAVTKFDDVAEAARDGMRVFGREVEQTAGKYFDAPGRRVNPSKFAILEKQESVVYGVFEPETGQAVYVGQVEAQKGIAARFAEHLRHPMKQHWKTGDYEFRELLRGEWTPFEAHAHEMAEITRHGGSGAENIKRPITPGKFHLYKSLHSNYPANPFQ